MDAMGLSLWRIDYHDTEPCGNAFVVKRQTPTSVRFVWTRFLSKISRTRQKPLDAAFAKKQQKKNRRTNSSEWCKNPLKLR